MSNEPQRVWLIKCALGCRCQSRFASRPSALIIYGVGRWVFETPPHHPSDRKHACLLIGVSSLDLDGDKRSKALNPYLQKLSLLSEAFRRGALSDNRFRAKWLCYGISCRESRARVSTASTTQALVLPRPQISLWGLAGSRPVPQGSKWRLPSSTGAWA